MLRFQSTQGRQLLPERTQLFYLATETNELLTIDSGFLKLSELLLVRGLYLGPARFEPFLDGLDSAIRLGQRVLERLRNLP